MASDNEKVVSRRSTGSSGSAYMSSQSKRVAGDGNVQKSKATGKSKNGSKKNVKKNQGGDVGTKIIMNLSNSVIRIAFDVIIYLLLIFATIYCCKYAYNFCYQVFGSASVTNSRDAITMNVTINDGESTLEIAERLEEYGLILNKYSFVVKGRVDEYAIKPGTFKLSSDMDYDEILEVICDTNNIIELDDSDDVNIEAEGSDTGDETGAAAE